MLRSSCHMSVVSLFSLEAIRTDGWFERVGEKVGSFESLCSILGERFFAFSLITGARVTSLTVDRRNPSASVVEFEVVGAGARGEAVSQRLSLDRFRRRLVSALLAVEDEQPPPTRETDVEGIQMHIGVRYLLLAPVFGYSLQELDCRGPVSKLRLLQDGEPRELTLPEFRATLRRWVLEEFERASAQADPNRSGLDLGLLPEAEQAAQRGDDSTVISLLGGWLMPLSFYLRTPEGKALTPELRGRLGGALGLLGTSLIRLGDTEAGQQSLRLAVQYAVETSEAGDAYARLGGAYLQAGRHAEAIAPLRRAAQLGAQPTRVWPALGKAFFEEGRLLAAWGSTVAAREAGVDDDEMEELRRALIDRLPQLERWRQLLEAPRAPE